MNRTRALYRIVGAGLIVGAVSCSPEVSESDQFVPERIRGVWVTDDPEYADQKLELMAEIALFHTGEDTFDPYVVMEVLALEEEGGTTYEINHTGRDGGEMTMSLFVGTGDTTLVFKNQPVRVWRRVIENR